VEVSEKEMSETKGFPLYMIYSSWSLSAITDFLQPFGGVNYLRILCDYKTKEETNRTLAVLKTETYQALVAAGHDKRQQDVDFSITPFQLKPSHFPGRDKSSKLFVQVPNCLRENESLVRQSLLCKFRELAGWGIIPDASWSIFIPLESRKHGHVRGGCYISFRKEVSMEAIAFVKICINDTYWTEDVLDEDGNEPVVLCCWAREYKKDPKKKDSESETSIEVSPDPPAGKEPGATPVEQPPHIVRLKRKSKAAAGQTCPLETSGQVCPLETSGPVEPAAGSVEAATMPDEI